MNEKFNPISEAIKNLGLRNPARRPGRWVGTCPFCRSPQGESFVLAINPDRRAFFHCFACGVDGKLQTPVGE